MRSERSAEEMFGLDATVGAEPKVPALVDANSFLFVRTTGVRNAPEVLVLEFFRELFFDPHYGGASERQLNPSDEELFPGERAILYVARGRVKGARNKGGHGFYAPVYPEQARVAWLRQKTDRALLQHLIRGALAQALASAKEEERGAVSAKVVSAILGRTRATSAADVNGKEFLSAAAAAASIAPGPVQPGAQHFRSFKEAVDNLTEELGYVANTSETCRLGLKDPLAYRIKDDFLALCDAEGSMPRLLWLEHLKTFLRTAVPVWVLAHMRMTVYLRDWIVEAIENGAPGVSAEEIQKAIGSRGEGLLHPTRTGSGELAMHVERYMKSRIEVSVLCHMLKANGQPDLFEKTLTVNGVGAGRLPTIELLQKFSNISTASSKDFRQLLLRKAETFSAWANPLKKGQGKNIDEFLRCLRRFEPGEGDNGFLAERTGPNQAIIFPGSGLIRLMLWLAVKSKERMQSHARGKLVLRDLEKQFWEYGLDFSVSAGARPRLIAELSRLGLLKGSPDAGDSTELVAPLILRSAPVGVAV